LINDLTSESSGEIDQSADFTLKTNIYLAMNRSDKQSPYLVFGKAVIDICIYCHRSDHDSELSNTPTHDESSDGQVILDGCTQDYKSDYV